MKALELIEIVKDYDDGRKVKRVLNKINMSVEDGELVAIVGPSGSGKSTLLSIAGGLLTPTTGEIKIKGKSISNLNAKQLTEIRLSEIGFIFQSSHLVPYLKTHEQLQLVRKLAKLPKEMDSNSVELLKDLNLDNVLEAYPETLSGGEKQRVAVARAFINDPSIILADEPTASVDADLGRQVVEMIRTLTLSRQKGALIVTHDDRVLDLMDKIYRLEEGKLTLIDAQSTNRK